jgi:hypothetical protein
VTEQPPPYPPDPAGGPPPPEDAAGPAFQLGSGATSPVPGPLATQVFMPGQPAQPSGPTMQFGAPPPGAPMGPPPGPPPQGPPPPFAQQQGPPPGYPQQGPPPGYPQQGPPPGYPPQGPPPGYPPQGPPPGYPPQGPPPGYPPQGPPPGYPPGPPPGYPQQQGAPPGYPPPPGYPQQYGAISPYQQMGQVAYPGPLATPGKRFVGYLLYIVLFIVTLVIGYIIWDIVLWKKGRTPVYQLMKMQVVKKDTGQPADRGTMFLRGFVGGILQSILNSFIIGYILLFMPFWDKDKQLIWDKISNTVVLDMSGVPGYS